MKKDAQNRVEPAIMVTGGAGFVGRHLVAKLIETKQPVVTVYHHKLPESHDHAYPVCSDLSSPELMAAPLRGVETVVHLAWEGGLAGPPDAATSQNGWRSVDAGRVTRNSQIISNLITAMERAGTKRLIFVSALGASPTAASAFLRDKYISEFLVLNSKIPEKIIIRSAVLFGGERGNDPFLRSILRVMKHLVYPVPKALAKVAPLFIDDLAATLVKACTVQMHATTALLDVEGGEHYAIEELLKIVSTNVTKKAQLAIGGFLGQSLMPFFERDGRAASVSPKLQHFLAVSPRPTPTLGASATTREASLPGVVPAKPQSFRDRLTAPS